jgi:hypothetical protein
MKKIALLRLALMLVPHSAFAERLYTSGFEWQTETAGVEFSSGDAGATREINTSDSSKIRTASSSMRVNPTAGNSWFGQVFRATPSNVESFTRIYINFETLPGSGTPEIFGFWNSSTVAMEASIRFDSVNGTLQLHGRDGTQYGSDSSALSADTWYMIELRLISDTAGGSADIYARLDGVEFASTLTGLASTFNAVYVGAPSVSSTYDIYYDDWAINNNVTATQNTYPGSGKVAIVRPNAAGDTNCSVGNYTMINEVPPSNTITSGSTICELRTNPSSGDFNVTDSAHAGIDSYDTITLVQLFARMTESAAGASNYTVRVKSASGGSASTSASVDAGDATVRTMPSGTTNWGLTKVIPLDPTTGVAWTPTGTNSIDNMQIGAATTDGAPDSNIVTYMAAVEFVDGSPPPAGAPPQTKSAVYFID